MEASVVDILLDSDESEESNNSILSLLNLIDDDSSSSCSSTTSENVPANHQRIKNFFEIIQSYSDGDFKKHFRLHRSTVHILIDRYKHLPRFNSTPRRGLPKTSAEKEVYIFLWYMANTNTFREVSNLFGVSQSTAWHIIQRVTMWLISIGHEYVKWPSRDEIAQNIALMEEKTKMPGILGCIDGSHIKIKAPVLNKENYFNRKHYYSILLQGVVNAKKKFINVFCGEPGSLHDSRLLRRSDLYRVSFERTEERFPFNSFLLGDSAYPCLEWLIPPFKDNGNMTDSQRRFNEIHSSGRIVIEHTFGLLKTRFRRILHFTEHTNINSVVNLVACACILHNMCVDNNDELEESHQHESFPELDSYSGTSSSSRQQQLMEDLINRHII